MSLIVHARCVVRSVSRGLGGKNQKSLHPPILKKYTVRHTPLFAARGRDDAYTAMSSMASSSLCSGVIGDHGHNAAPLADDPCCESCNHEVTVARVTSSMVSGLKQPGVELNRQVGELKKSRSREVLKIF